MKKLVKYNKQVFKQVLAPNQTSCDGCYFLTYPDGAMERPCGKSPLDPKFPECLASERKDKKHVVFVLNVVVQRMALANPD